MAPLQFALLFDNSVGAQRRSQARKSHSHYAVNFTDYPGEDRRVGGVGVAGWVGWGGDGGRMLGSTVDQSLCK